MSKQRYIEWWALDGDCDVIGSFLLTTDSHDDWLCPKCGKACQYWEGVIDQDFQGNDIRGWSFECLDCLIVSEATEGDSGYSYD